MRSGLKTPKDAIKTRISVNPLLAEVLRLASDRRRITVSQVLDGLARTLPDYSELFEQAQKTLGMTKTGEKPPEATVHGPLVNRSVGQVGQVEVPVITRDPVAVPSRIFWDTLRGLGRAAPELEPADVEALVEVHALAGSMNSTIGGDALFGKWLHIYITETPEPRPRDLMLKVHRYPLS